MPSNTMVAKQLAMGAKRRGASGTAKGRKRSLQLFLLITITILLDRPSLHGQDDTPQGTYLSREHRFVDLSNKPYTLKASTDNQALVLIFVTTDCPIANSYQPLLNRLLSDFQEKGFEFVLVHEGPMQTPTKLKEHASEYSVKCAVALDAEHTIAHNLGATKTPEAFVLGRDGKILYQGRIDNLYQGFGKKRSAATRDDLRIALTEIDAGDKVSVPKTEAIGCSIPLRREAQSKP